MTTDLTENNNNLSRRDKLIQFYKSNKALIFSIFAIILILLGSFSYYNHHLKIKKILISDNFINAKIYLQDGKKDKALKLLKEIIFSNSNIYSPICLFLILDQNLISESTEISALFDHILKNNKFDKEIKNLIIYKQAIFNSSFKDEKALLTDIYPLLNSDSVWKSHGLLLLGDFFVEKKDYEKAKYYFKEITLIKNLHKDIYDQATSKLINILND